MIMQKVGVVGPGNMGAGIARHVARSLFHPKGG